MKILIIGGTRFFGKRLTRILIQEGRKVTLLTRGQTPDEFGPMVTRLKADRTKPEELKAAITQDYDVVIDNMCMNAAEANAAIEVFTGRIGHYVMTSTLSVYDQKAAIKESDFDARFYVPQEAKHPGEAYKEGKRAAEHAFLNAPFSVSRMRIPIVLGEDDYTQRLALHVNACKNGQPIYIPSPASNFSYVNAADAARALYWMARTKHNDVFNISSNEFWTLADLVKQIEKATKKTFVYGTENDTPSPFGITEDYYMDVMKAKVHGFQSADLTRWMPELIRSYAK